ncbi:MAG: type II secretion system protein [Phycisphaerae bacterium]
MQQSGSTCTGSRKHRGFTLIEMIVVMAIIALLVAIVVPSLSKARVQAQSTECLAHLRELARGWQMYTDENDGVFVPHRMPRKEGLSASESLYDVGNGEKERPRWPGVLSSQIGIPAFDQPDPMNNRQDYDGKVYACPTEPKWVDERNMGYGYNYQFLGNSRPGKSSSSRPTYFPVFQSAIKSPSGTVVFADSMGTAAGYTPVSRKGFSSDDNDPARFANHGYTLDPPRLTPNADRAEENDRIRSAVDPRHGDKCNAVFMDTHAENKRPRALGYRLGKGDCYGESSADDTCRGIGSESSFEGTEEEKQATNRFFSGSGRDEDPVPRL